MNLGEKIKRLRVKMNLTQEEVAVRCELSKGFISQLERDITSPSIATLCDILDCLGTNLKDFFNETENNKIVFKKDDIFWQVNDNLGYTIQWLIPNAQKNIMEPILLNLIPGGKSDEYTPHDCEVFGFVISGSPTLNVGDTSFKLKKNESFYYKANAPYSIENNTKNPVSVLWVSTPPSF